MSSCPHILTLHHASQSLKTGIQTTSELRCLSRLQYTATLLMLHSPTVPPRTAQLTITSSWTCKAVLRYMELRSQRLARHQQMSEPAANMVYANCCCLYCALISLHLYRIDIGCMSNARSSMLKDMSTLSAHKSYCCFE